MNIDRVTSAEFRKMMGLPTNETNPQTQGAGLQSNVPAQGKRKKAVDRPSPELCAVAERAVRDATLGQGAAEERDSKRYLVRITRVRARALDDDNLCGKYVCDTLRYAGCIPEDNPRVARIEVTQRFDLEEGEEPHTLIEVFEV